MKFRVLVTAGIAVAAAFYIAGTVGAGNAPKPARHSFHTSTAVCDWTMCRMLMAERHRLFPRYSADYFKPAKMDDIGKTMLTTVGPASGSMAALERFRHCLRNKNSMEAGRIIDQRQVIWLEPGRRVVLEALNADGVARIMPSDGFVPMYVLDWSIKPME